MHLHQSLTVRGCITQEKYIKGKSLSELERILGFHTGRLRNGIVVAALQQTPTRDQFDLLGYTQVAGHKINGDTFEGLEIDKLKELVIKTVFSNSDVERLVKVLPNTPHSNVMDNDSQYPPGQGVPQWKLTQPLNAQVVAIVTEGQKYK